VVKRGPVFRPQRLRVRAPELDLGAMDRRLAELRERKMGTVNSGLAAWQEQRRAEKAAAARGESVVSEVAVSREERERQKNRRKYERRKAALAAARGQGSDAGSVAVLAQEPQAREELSEREKGWVHAGEVARQVAAERARAEPGSEVRVRLVLMTLLRQVLELEASEVGGRVQEVLGRLEGWLWLALDEERERGLG
jgi:hypothetical protein